MREEEDDALLLDLLLVKSVFDFVDALVLVEVCGVVRVMSLTVGIEGMDVLDDAPEVFESELTPLLVFVSPEVPEEVFTTKVKEQLESSNAVIGNINAFFIF